MEAEDAKLLELLDRIDDVKTKHEEKRAREKARWDFYYEQLAKHAPFGGSEGGSPKTFRWD